MTRVVAEQKDIDLEAMKRELGCTRRCECIDPDTGAMPQVRPFAGGIFTECMEQRPCLCNKKLYFGGTTFCKCPLWQKISTSDQP